MLKKQRRQFSHLSAILTLFFFLFSNFSTIPQAAANDEIRISEPAVSFVSKLSPNLGHIKEVSLQSSDSPVIIHIQDAHAVPSAQRKIQDILRWISQEEKNKKIIVGLEGAVGDIHPEYLELIKNKPLINEAVVTDLWEKGELTGGDLFAWELHKRGGDERGRVRFVGIETPELYRENLLSYRTLLYQQPEISEKLSSLRSLIDIAKTRHFSPELMEFVREKERRKEGRFDPFRQDAETEIHLDGYMRFLVKKAAEILNIDLKDPIEQLRFTNLSHLFSLEDLQKSLNSEKAGAEKKDLLAKLQDKNLNEQIRSLENSPAPRAVIETLYETASKTGLALKAYPEFFKWAASAVLKAELNSDQLFDEIETLEALIFKKIAKTESQNKVLDLIHRYDHLEKLLFLKLSREEFSRLSEKLIVMSPEAIVRDTQALANKKVPAAELSGYFDEAVNFYATAVSRDEALLENLLKADAPETVKILISGGFHTGGLTAIMREKNLGYTVIMPNFSTENSKGLSAKVFKDENADLSGRLASEPADKQSRLFLKELLDVALPKLSQDSKQTTADQNFLLKEAVAASPVLSSVVSVAKDSELSRLSPAALLQLNTVGDASILLAPKTYRSVRRDPIQNANRFALRPEIRTAAENASILKIDLPVNQALSEKNGKVNYGGTFVAGRPLGGEVGEAIEQWNRELQAISPLLGLWTESSHSTLGAMFRSQDSPVTEADFKNNETEQVFDLNEVLKAIEESSPYSVEFKSISWGKGGDGNLVLVGEVKDHAGLGKLQQAFQAAGLNLKYKAPEAGKPAMAFVTLTHIDSETLENLTTPQAEALRDWVAEHKTLQKPLQLQVNEISLMMYKDRMLRKGAEPIVFALGQKSDYNDGQALKAVIAARAGEAVRAEIRTKKAKSQKLPKLFFSSLLASQYYGQRDRKFYAFLPPEGKISIVLKIGGKSIAAKILLPDGSFAEKSIFQEPIYAKELGIDPSNINRKGFTAALARYASEGGKTKKQALEELQRRTINQMMSQLMTVINWAKQDLQAVNIYDHIHVVGIASHGPFDHEAEHSGTFLEAPAVLPFLPKMSLGAELKSALDAESHLQSSKIRVEVLEDMSAAGAGEISRLGSFPGQKKAMYISWGTRVASSLYIDGEPFLHSSQAPSDFGEIGEQMVWFPETRSYEWMGQRSKMANGRRALARYHNGNEHYGSENMAAYFGKDDFRNLRPGEVIRAGWDMGRMIGAYIKAIGAEYGPNKVPEKIVLGSVVPEDLGRFNPYLIDAIREGFHRELKREHHEELGYIEGLLGKHDSILLKIESDNEHDKKKRLEHILRKNFGGFYATNYMRAFEAKKTPELDEQVKALQAIKAKHIEVENLLTFLPAGADIRRAAAKAKTHVRNYEYGAAITEVEKLLALLDPNAAVETERKAQYNTALTKLKELYDANIDSTKIREGRLSRNENLPFRDWETPVLYGGEHLNFEEWVQVMETWVEFGHQVQEERVVEVGRDPGAGSTAAKKSVRLLMTDRDEMTRLKQRGIEVYVGPWAGPHFVKSRETGEILMHVGYVGKGFADVIKSLLPAGITVKTDPNYPNVLIFSGGSGAPGLHVPILRKLMKDIDPLFKIAVLLTDTDDGGSSWKLVEALIKNGYGIYPPFGDIVNALFNSFLPAEMLANILDDGGRLANKPTNQVEGQQNVRDSVKQRLDAARENFGIHEGHELYERFNIFEERILHWMLLVDHEFFSDANPILQKKGASIRNLVLLGALLESGTLRKQVEGDHPNALFKQEDQAKFQQTLNTIAEAFGIKDAITSVSSFDDATLWAEYEENVILFKDSAGNDVAVGLMKGPGGTIRIRDPRYERAQPVLIADGQTQIVQGVTFGNIDGEAYIEKDNQKWFLQEDKNNWKTYLHHVNTKQKIEIFNDGSGRPAEIGRKFEKNAPKGDHEKNLAKQGFFIGSQEIYVRSRFIVRQTNATETANFSQIVDMGAIEFMGHRSLQDMNPKIHGKAQHANPEAVKLLENTSDLILMGPGSLHTSLMPHLLSKGIIEALIKKGGHTIGEDGEIIPAEEGSPKIKRAFVFNPNRDNETIGMQIEKIIEFIERVASRTLNRPVKFEQMFDAILVNDGVAPADEWKDALLARHEIRMRQDPVDRLGLRNLSTRDLHQKLAAYPASQQLNPRTELALGVSRTLSGQFVGYYDDPLLMVSERPEGEQGPLLNTMFISPAEAEAARGIKSSQAISQSERSVLVSAYAALFENGGKVVLPAQALAILNAEELKQYVDILMAGLIQSGVELQSPVVIIAGSQAVTPAIREAIQQATLSTAALREVFSIKPLEEGLVANQFERDAVSVSLANAETENLPNQNIPTYVLDLAALKGMKESAHRVKYLTAMTQLQFLTAEELDQQVELTGVRISEEMVRLLNRIGVEFGNSAGGYLMPQAESLLEGQVAEFIASRKAEVSA